ncbi:isochorismate synthase [Schaalia cardiffensis]|uniref:isochorismate synthase n=1 Tax=Schaalia cardiffensis TaxID=181487 RepID=UPI0023F0FDF3|nr:isochorismate synthase [Schaalia cardiffensis]
MPNASTTESLHARAVSLAGTQWAHTPLLRFLPEDPREDAAALAWLGFRCQMVGWGRAAAWKGSGAHAIGEAGAWWDRLRTASSVSVDVHGPHSKDRELGKRTSRAPLSGDSPSAEAASHLERALPSFPIAFGSFGFSARTESTLIVPSFLLIDTPEGRWAVSISSSSPVPDPLEVLKSTTPTSPRPPRGLRTDVGRMTQREWRASVEALAARLRAGDASKAVMTRDMLVRADSAITAHYLLERLDSLYPQTWRFCVDSLIGASPEMLGSAADGVLHSRVLAGTSPAGRGAELLESEKNLREHTLAVESVASALRPIVDDLQVPETPFILDLPNVAHLASDVQARLGELSLLEAVAALHPTAAVCGTPRDLALELLEEHERTERGRYSGPVGWVDANGEGEFCIALRCGALEEEGRALRIFAGGGIMPDSDPGEELAETRRKMAPLLDALGVDATA